MQLLDLTLETPEENLAIDKALLESTKRTAQSTEIIRASTADDEVLRTLWEPKQLMVVVGSSSRLTDEVYLEVRRTRRAGAARPAAERRLSPGQAV